MRLFRHGNLQYNRRQSNHPQSGNASWEGRLEEEYPLTRTCLPEGPLRGECLLLPSVQPGAWYRGMNMEIPHGHNIGGRLLPAMGVADEGFQGGLAFKGISPLLHILLLLAGVGIPLAGSWLIFPPGWRYPKSWSQMSYLASCQRPLP